MVINNIEYDYSLLQNRIKEEGYSQTSLAKELGMARNSMNLKLNNKAHFTQSEIIKLSYLLGIGGDEIGEYFFSQIVRKTELKV
ncbi:DUF739 family protein [Latilactobacillus sakei]|uniref:DUF739 family protein n=1 Tax=Latilactobacillus sakei TaxID=1599 RepID=UPI00345CE0B6